MNSETLNTLDSYSKNKYKYGFVTEIDNEKPKKGLSEDTIKFISKIKNLDNSIEVIEDTNLDFFSFFSN